MRTVRVNSTPAAYTDRTRRGAAVAGVQGIRNASLLACAIMERSGYSLMAGAGAERFCPRKRIFKAGLADRTQPEDVGFLEANPIRAGVWLGQAPTIHPGQIQPGRPASCPHRKRIWTNLFISWSRWRPGTGITPQWSWRAVYDALFPATDTLYVSCLNQKNEISSVATTSGMPWRPPGVAGDVPMIGAGGCYLRSRGWFGRRRRKRRSQHQDQRRPHHRRKHAPRDVA